jgi:hypothetical protein
MTIARCFASHVKWSESAQAYVFVRCNHHHNEGVLIDVVNAAGHPLTAYLVGPRGSNRLVKARGAARANSR